MPLDKISTVDLVRELLNRLEHGGVSIYDECQKSFDDLEQEITQCNSGDQGEDF